jgi:hypothetical protein
MRKFIVYSLLLIIFSFFTFYFSLLPVYAAGATLSLSPASGTFNKSCSFTININLDTGGVATDGTDSILFYDPTRFNAVSIQSGTIYSDYPGNNIDAQQGKITISGLSSVSSAFSGTGTLATINFTVADEAPVGISQIKFDFDPNNKAKTTDSNVVERGTVADILNQVVDGNYTIGTGSCASASATPAPGKGSPETGTPVPTKILSPGGKEPGTVTPALLIATVGTLFTLLGAAGTLRHKTR